MAEDDNFNVDNWATQIRRGLLELCVLNMVAEGEVYGYDLVRRITEMRGLGIAEGSIYPLLSRMRKAGLLRARLEESPNGPARKYYALTQNGVKCCTMMNSHWDELARGIYSLRPGEVGTNGNRGDALRGQGDVSPTKESFADSVARESEA